MNTKLLQALALILLGVCTLAAQDRYIYNDTVMKQTKFIVAADVRYATFNKQSDFYDNDVINSGLSYDVSVYYKAHKHLAIGVKYNLFTGNDTYRTLVTDGLGNLSNANVKENVTISFIGFSMRLDASRERNAVHWYGEGAVGYFHHNQELKHSGSSNYKYGGVGGISMLGVEFRLFKDFYIGPKVGIVYGVGLGNSKYTENGQQVTISSSGLDNAFLRFEGGAGASYRF